MKGGVVPLRVVAERWGATMRCAKRRLIKLDRRIGGGLLVQLSAGGHYLVDISMLKRYLPGLAHDDAEDPAVTALLKLVTIEELIREVLERVA